MYQEKIRAFRGSFKYPLHRLDCESVSEKTHQLDSKNVERLIKVFQLEGCLRLHTENHVPALISEHALSLLLRSVAGGEDRLKAADEEPPLVNVPEQLTYLHGRHRLEAAKKFLPASEKWWIVDLYAEDVLSEKGVQAIRDEYLNARNFCDGEIFRCLRQCHLIGDESGKKKWLSRLSKAKQRDVETLEKRRDSESKRFARSLDELIPFAGLWPALQVGTFHRLLSIRCLEEMSHYLHVVWQTWDFILQDNSALHTQLDVGTVEVLQGRDPSYSKDRIYIETRRSDVFTEVRSLDVRQKLWDRIFSFHSIVPSLHTFLEDTKYLEPCAKVLKGLLPGKLTSSIQQAFERLHNGQRVLQYQDNEYQSHPQEQSSVATNHWKAYRQLWLYAMRHFPHMVGHAPRKDVRTTRYLARGPELMWWHGIAELATACGYDGVNNPFSSAVEADVKMTEEFLRRVRPATFGCDSTAFDNKVKEIVATLQATVPSEYVSQLAQPSAPCPDDLSYRCGVPFEYSFDSDNRFLFLEAIYREVQSETVLTSFSVKRNMFRMFFGTLDAEPFLAQPEEAHLNVSEPRLGDRIMDGLMDDESILDEPDGVSVAALPAAAYSASEYSQPSGSLTPRPISPKDPILPNEPLNQMQSSSPSQPPSPLSQVQRLQTLPNQSLSQVEALKIFWTFQDNSPDPDKMIIIKEESSGRFTLHVLAHDDQRGIINTVGNRKALVREGPNSNRQRVTGLVDIKRRREPCVMVYHPLHDRQIQ